MNKQVAKKPVKKTTKKPVKKAAAKPVSTKVDYYPNRMTFAVSALAGTLIVLMALIATVGL